MGLKRFFLDTYAMHEIVNGSSSYKRFFDKKAITTKLNLMEFYYSFSQKTHPEFAKRFYDYFSEFVLVIDHDVIIESMNFRAKHKKKKLSYVDCVGYIMARKNNSLFLTGDKEFEGLEGVEFIK